MKKQLTTSLRRLFTRFRSRLIELVHQRRRRVLCHVPERTRCAGQPIPARLRLLLHVLLELRILDGRLHLVHTRLQRVANLRILDGLHHLAPHRR